MSEQIVFMHLGAVGYVELAVQRALAAAPQSQVVLLADFKIPAQPKLEQIEIARYWNSAQAFGKIYQHCSSYAPEYECFCFQRWFALCEFMRARKLDSVLALDSDVLLFNDFSQLYLDVDLALSKWHSPHVLKINSLAVLEDFCGFITEFFTQKVPIIEQLKRDGLLQQMGLLNQVIPLNDMRLWQSFIASRNYFVADTTLPVNGAVCDHNINIAHGFKMQAGIKEIFWKDKLPYVTRKRDGKEYRLNLIHCQAGAKSYMAELSSCCAGT